MTMLTQKLNSPKKNNEKGATAVEFAVIAALLFLILFGILEFGMIFMQEHYVANAAREGVRIGVRANNYNSATSPYYSPVENEYPDEGTCQTSTNRSVKIDCEIRLYLKNMYGFENPVVTVDVLPDSATLEVSVTTENFFPPIIANLAKLVAAGDASFTLPDKISFKTTGDYEDQDEWEAEKP